jgi:hypothetical protein
MPPIDTASPAPVSRAFLRGISQGLLVFATVLTAVLLLSWMFLLPRFTRFRVEGRTLTPDAMAAYEHSLRAELLTMEEERIRLVLPFQHPLFSHLQSAKQAHPPLTDLRAALRHAAARVQATDAVVLQSLHVEGGTGRVEMTGDVRHVGPRSMTVLAAFLDEVEQLPFVTGLERPAFSRVDDPVIGPHSPFHIVFHWIFPS